MSAVLHHAHVDITLRRPAGAKGHVRTGWLNPADARTIIAAAETLDTEFAELLLFLLYTGCRLGEALALPLAPFLAKATYSHVCAVWVQVVNSTHDKGRYHA